MGEDGSHLAGACGTYCGACLAFHGELAAKAAELMEDISRQGFLSMARRLDPVEADRIDSFLDVLDRIARTPACPGCGLGGGTPDCPVRRCARERALVTCADCPDLDPCSTGRESPPARSIQQRDRREALRAGRAAIPFGAAGFLSRLTRKYEGWNLRNLERIRSHGLSSWLEAMAADPSFRTVSIKTAEDIWSDD